MAKKTKLESRPIEIPDIKPGQDKISGIKKGLEKYQSIQNKLCPTEEIKKVFLDFYGLNNAMKKEQKDKDRFFEEFFPDDPFVFAKRLKEEREATKFYFSFATKAIHTFHPDSPIYDSHVLKYLKEQEGITEIRIPDGSEEARKENWEKIKEWYQKFEKDPRRVRWIKWFNETFHNELFDEEKGHGDISDTKKIDFIIYMLGVEKVPVDETV